MRFARQLQQAAERYMNKIIKEMKANKGFVL